MKYLLCCCPPSLPNPSAALGARLDISIAMKQLTWMMYEVQKLPERHTQNPAFHIDAMSWCEEPEIHVAPQRAIYHDRPS